MEFEQIVDRARYCALYAIDIPRRDCVLLRELAEQAERRAQRLQGMLKYGFNWTTELQAQKAIVTFFDRQLEKGYTLIRNMPLGASGITVPMILLGPAGIYVIHVTYLRGRYEEKCTRHGLAYPWWIALIGGGGQIACVAAAAQSAVVDEGTFMVTRDGAPWVRYALVEAAGHGMKRPDALGRWARLGGDGMKRNRG